MNNKIDFIMAAIADTQGTIRATDVKVGALLAGMLLPLASLGKIWVYFISLLSLVAPWLGIFSGVIFFSTWFFTILSLVRTISAIDNPSNHILNANDYKGSFYGGGIYQFGWLDSLLNRSIIKANRDVIRFSNEYPADKDSIIDELTFEHMKLIYIREIKLYRLDFALKFALVWLVVGISVYLFSKLG